MAVKRLLESFQDKFELSWERSPAEPLKMMEPEVIVPFYLFPEKPANSTKEPNRTPKEIPAPSETAVGETSQTVQSKNNQAVIRPSPPAAKLP